MSHKIQSYYYEPDQYHVNKPSFYSDTNHTQYRPQTHDAHNHHRQRQHQHRHTQFNHNPHNYHRPHNNNNAYHNHFNPNTYTHQQNNRHRYNDNGGNHNRSEIISVQTDSLILQQKPLKSPYFYDKESRIAQQCSQTKVSFSMGVIERKEQQRLIHQRQCDLITLHKHKSHSNVDSEGNPCTPDLSDTELESTDNNQFGVIGNRRMRHINERTNELRLVNESGINLLENDGYQKEKYGIYCEESVCKQMLLVPKEVTLDIGSMVCEAMESHTREHSHKKMNSKKGKTRRGGKGKGKDRNMVLGRTEMDRLEAQELAKYLQRIRNTQMNGMF